MFTKKLLIVALLLMTTWASANTSNKNMLILEEIQKAIQKDFALHGGMKTITINPEPEPEPVDEMTAGKARVQRQLERNRRRLQKSQGISGGKALTGKEKIKMMLEKNKKRIQEMQANDEKKEEGQKKSGDWMSDKMNQNKNWMNNKKKAIRQWEDEKKKIIAKWINERKKFIKRIPEYKENLTTIEEEPELEPIKVAKKKRRKKKKPIIKKVKMPVFSDYHMITSAFVAPASDQGRRPTCAAFAGVRALEILLARKEGYQKLSEQYFFWASKPKCQSTPCKKSGSWVLKKYKASRASSRPDIPLDRDCPYNRQASRGNVTQTPIKNSCHRGKIKVTKFSKVNSSAEIITALKNNYPVVSAFRLSKNFYRNKGYVFVQNANTGGAMDSHAAGHAILLVGYMKLPKKLHRKEGRFCLITANSWGVGWGKGGHACLSEKWIKKFRYDIPFISVERIGT